MHRVVVELGDRFKRGAVVRVDEGQVFDVQDVHDIGALGVTHRYPRVAASMISDMVLKSSTVSV